MASLIPSGSASGSGSMTLAAPITNSNQTVTIPDATGTVMVSGAMPAFSAYNNSAFSMTGGVFTKIPLQVEEFDTNSNFDNTTNYRFTPTVAGYYQINGNVYFSTSTTTVAGAIYRNGVEYKRGSVTNAGAASNISVVMYFNGSTDYVELYGYTNSTQNTQAGISYTYFNGCLLRAA